MKKILIPTLLAAMVTSPFSKAEAYNYSDWAVREYYSANKFGLLTTSSISGKPSANITRQEFCDLIMNMYVVMTGSVPEMKAMPFTDTDSKSVQMAYSLGIIDGKSETLFYPDDYVLRQEMAKIIMRTLTEADKDIKINQSDIERLWKFSDFSDTDSWATEDLAKSVKYQVINGFSESQLLPKGYATREQAIAIANRAFNTFSNNKTTYQYPKFTDIFDGITISDSLSFSWTSVPNADSYTVFVKDGSGNIIKSVPSSELFITLGDLPKNAGYTIIVGARFGEYITVYSDPCYVYFGKESIHIPSTQKGKYNRVFPGGKAFTTKAEADANMKTIYVPVWQMDKNGNKYSNKLPLTVNVNLAQDIMQIFTNIYRSPEKFPIKDVGAYSWRNTAFGSVSHHSYGTCIDINYDENYYCHPSGEAITGSFWKPYENPFSVTPDGSVVQNFKKYGWTWGGDWTNLKDYMHFSYLGK